MARNGLAKRYEMANMKKKTPMSETAKQYFSDSGQYTGYKGPKSNKGAYSTDGAVTKPHKSKPFKPGISIGDAVRAIGTRRSKY